MVDDDDEKFETFTGQQTIRIESASNPLESEMKGADNGHIKRFPFGQHPT